MDGPDDLFGDIDISLVQQPWTSFHDVDIDTTLSYLMTQKEPVLLGEFLRRLSTDAEDEGSPEDQGSQESEQEEQQHVVLTPVIVQKTTVKRKASSRATPPPPKRVQAKVNPEGEKRLRDEIQRLAELVGQQQTQINMLVQKMQQPLVSIELPLSIQQKILSLKDKPFPKLIHIPQKN